MTKARMCTRSSHLLSSVLYIDRDCVCKMQSKYLIQDLRPSSACVDFMEVKLE